jgi:hypothetical protein
MKTAEKRTIEQAQAAEVPANERRPEIGFLIFMIVILAALINFSGLLSLNVGGAVNAAPVELAPAS